MKKALLSFSLFLSGISLFAQPIVYFDFMSHNEDTPQWSVTNYYTANRAKLILLANYFQANNITWNMQNEYVYLNSVLTKETTALKALTNNKNILRWMYEDKGVEMDPHSHETTYIYPDVDKLMDSIGLPESKVVGGALYSTYNGINIWSNLINGQNGVIFPTHSWQPEYCMCGGTPMHVADLKYYGFWNPTDTDNYLVHNPSSPLHHIGTGCDIKVKDTSTVKYIVRQLREVLNNVQSGNYPSNGIYFQTVFFEIGDLGLQPFYDTLIRVADSMNVMVQSGQAQWKTFKQMSAYWQTTYNSQVFQWECGQMVTGDRDLNNEPSVKLFPNPSSDKLKLELNNFNLETDAELKIYDLFGKQIYFSSAKLKNEIDVSNLTSGMYFTEVKNGDAVYRNKFLKE